MCNSCFVLTKIHFFFLLDRQIENIFWPCLKMKVACIKLLALNSPAYSSPAIRIVETHVEGMP